MIPNKTPLPEEIILSIWRVLKLFSFTNFFTLIGPSLWKQTVTSYLNEMQQYTRRAQHQLIVRALSFITTMSGCTLLQMRKKFVGIGWEILPHLHIYPHRQTFNSKIFASKLQDIFPSKIQLQEIFTSKGRKFFDQGLTPTKKKKKDASFIEVNL